MLLSLLVGSLGLQAAIASEWLRVFHLNKQQQLAEEEELLTPYNSKDSETPAAPVNDLSKTLTDKRPSGWEFKIVRASRAIFHNPTVFQHLCDEEAQAGWILLEKLDDQRVRFKRPIAFRDMIKADSLLFDPYRTQYGSSASLVGGLLSIIVLLIVTFLPAYLGYALVSITLTNARPESSMPNSPQREPSPQPPQSTPILNP